MIHRGRLLLGFLLAFGGGAWAFGADEDVTFYAPFDGKSDATVAQGLPAAKVHGEISYTAGVTGQALVVGGKRSVVYNATKNVPTAAGTLSLWARPLDWTPVKDHFVFFITLLRVQDKRVARLMLYKVYNTASLLLLAESGDPRDSQQIHCPAASWQANEWRHFAMTWDSQWITLYVNGEVSGRAPAVRPPAEGWGNLVVGTSYPSWAYVGEETTAIDELRVFGHALSAEEVRTGFENSLRQNKVLSGVFEARRQAREKRRRENLVRAGGYVLASSFMDYRDHYTDNLIDGDPNSTWRPKEAEFPQWIELRWRYPVRVNKVAFEEVPPNAVTAASVVVFRQGQPETVRKVVAQDMPPGPYKVLEIPEVATDRLRLVLEAGTSGFPQLAEVEAFGPPQPLVGRNEPYWDAGYIWYPEPDKVHKANAPRYFRKTFEISDLPAIRTAFVQARSNDYYKVFVNGTQVATGSTEIQPVDVKSALRPGKNVIAAIADLGSNPGQWGWGELLIELSLNYPGKTVRVGTDATWRTHNVEAAGWQQADFDDTPWLPAAPYVRPPEGPWGRIPYSCTSVREHCKVGSVTVSPAEAKPGETVHVRATLTAAQPLKGDYFFIFDLGEKAVEPSHGDFSVVRAVVEAPSPSPTWKPGAEVSVSTEMQLPEFAPNGRVPLRIRAVERHTGLDLDLEKSTGGPADDLGAVTVTRYPAKAVDRPPVSGSLSFENGQAAFRVGGEIKPPLLWRYCPLNSFERTFHYAADTGIHLHHFMIYPHVIDVDRESWQKGFAELDQNINCALRVDPKADLMVLVDLRPSNAWLKAHPEERLINGFGAPGPVSYASKRYEEEAHAYLRSLITFLKTKPYYGRVIAIKPMTCGVADSGLGGVEINTWQADRRKLTVGDYNPQAIAAFCDWLRAKYANDVGRLRKAWNSETVTFETAAPVFGEFLKEGENGGIFRDPVKGRMTFDYFEFLPGLLGRFYQRAARLIKEETGGKVMVMIHYGYIIAHLTSCNNPGSIFQNNNFDFPDMLDDPNIDAYLGAPDYGNRRAGDPYTLYFPVASITLHRRQYIADGDYRTFVAAPVIHGRQRSARETEAVLKKDLACCIIGNSGTWFSDMSVGSGRSAVGFFLEDSILRTVRQMNDLFVSALKTERKPAAQIAVFMSTSTPKYHDAYYASTLYRNLIVYTYWRELPRIGAPFDCYMMDDLGRPDLRKDYKLYIFLNPFFMSDTERRAVEALKRDGKTLLWFYAPGYVDNERGLSPRHITEVAGIGVEKKADKELMRCTVVGPEHPITTGLALGHAYAVSPYGYPETDRLHPTAFGPVFRVSDPAAVPLARYADGSVAFAVRDFGPSQPPDIRLPDPLRPVGTGQGAWRSVYMALPYLDTHTLRNIAKFAGVHVYCDDDIILNADNRFLMVHNGYGAERLVALRLPEPRTVTDALSGKRVAENTAAFSLRIPECTTEILQLGQ